MYFIPKDKNRLYRWAITQTVFIRYALLIGGTVFFCIMWYFGVYARCDAALKHKHTIINRMQKQCAALGASKKQCEQLQAEINVCNNALHAQCAKQKRQDDLMFVLDSAQKNHLQFGSYSTQQTIDKKWYTKEIAQCNFSGTLPNITAFLADIKNNDRMIQCKNMNVKHDDEGRYNFSCQLGFGVIT